MLRISMYITIETLWKQGYNKSRNSRAKHEIVIQPNILEFLKFSAKIHDQ